MQKYNISKSNIEGSGVFAENTIKKGEVIFILKGKKVTFFIKNKKDSMLGGNWIGTGKNTWLDVKKPFVFLNHSCDPNAGIKGSVTVIARKDIKPHEEITIDYSITEEDLFWSMSCKCTSEKCRKVIRSIQFLPNEIFKAYLPYVPTYFKKVYENN